MIVPMDEIDHAVEILRRGGLVAFPTETVYGLGADATNSAAVGRIFEAKGRPATNPLIAHVADAAVARRYAAAWPEAAERLARRFWPGSLTLVLPKHPSIVPEATAGLGTAGLRCPDHPLALELLRRFDGPIAAPSANRSTRVSPTTAQHVREELGDRVDLILDGGECRVGIESTVLDLAGGQPTILRPGAVTREQLQQEIGAVQLAPGIVDPSQPVASPGQHRIHYAPSTPAYRFDRAELPRIIAFCRDAAKPVAIMLIAASDNPHPGELPNVRQLTMPADPAHYARRLYATLRRLDADNLRAICVEMPPAQPNWTAVRDRLLRATTSFV